MKSWEVLLMSLGREGITLGPYIPHIGSPTTTTTTTTNNIKTKTKSPQTTIRTRTNAKRKRTKSDEVTIPRKSPGIQTRSQKRRLLNNQGSPTKIFSKPPTWTKTTKNPGVPDPSLVQNTPSTGTRKPGPEGGGLHVQEEANNRACALGKKAHTHNNQQGSLLSVNSNRVRSKVRPKGNTQSNETEDEEVYNAKGKNSKQRVGAVPSSLLRSGLGNRNNLGQKY